MNLFVFCSLAFVLGVQSETTTYATVTHQHHTKDPNEKESFHFRYDGRKHTLVITVQDECYIMKLTDSQLAQVHDPDNIRKIEATALKLIANRNHQTDVDQTTLNHNLLHDCNGASKVIHLANKDSTHHHQSTPAV